MSKLVLVAIVDDDEVVRSALEAFLQSLGYLTFSYGSATAFLESPLRPNAACLICDMHMPGMDGEELQFRLTKEGHHLPIIFLSAACSATLRTRVVQAGAVDLLPKPFEQNHLIACLDNVLRTE
jgi:FixJ family two-component response regulator